MLLANYLTHSAGFLVAFLASVHLTAAIFMWTAPPPAWNQTVAGTGGARTVVTPVRNGTTDYPLRWNYTLLADQNITRTFFAVGDGIRQPQDIGFVVNPGRVGENTTINNLNDFQTRFRLQSDQESSTLIINKVNERENATFSLKIQVASDQWIYNVRIEVTVPPSITHISGNQTVTEGQNVTLNCTADGNPTPNITWTILSDNSAVQMPLKNIRRQEKGEYRCTANNGVGSPATRDTSIVVHYKPDIVTLEANTTENEDCADILWVNFTCLASEANPPVQKYRLFGKGEFPSPSGTWVQEISEKGKHVYRCLAQHPLGNVTSSNSISVTFNVPVHISTNLISGSNTPIRGNDVSLYCNASGFPEPSITWSKVLSNALVSINSSKWFHFTNIEKDETGDYICQANNTCGKKNSSVIPINVQHEPESVTLSVSISSNRVCAQNMVKFTCKAGAAEPDVKRYTLYQNDAEIASMSGSGVFTLWLNTSGQFIHWCVANNSLGTGTSNNITLIVEVPALVVYVNHTIVVTEGENATLFCNASGVSSSNVWWVNGKNGLPRVGATLFLANLTEDNQGEVYTCIASNTCGNSSKATTIDVQHVPKDVVLNVSIPGGKVCAGDMVQFICKAGTANPEVENYTLYQNGEVIANMSGSGVFTLLLNIRGHFIYRCVAENSIGTGTSNNASVTVEGPFSVTSVSLRTVVKEGDNVTLFCKVTGDPAPNISWVDSRDEVRKNGTTWNLPKINRALKGEYSCVASNACGRCSKTTAIDVQYPPTATGNGQNKTLLRGSSETLACPLDGNPEPRIVWYKEKEGGGTALSTRKELKFLDAKSDHTGCYTCSASNSLGTPINITQCIIVVEPTSPVTSTPTTPRETTVVTWRITLTITNKDCNSFPEQEFRREVEKSLEHLGLNDIKIKTRCGSVVADLVLGFNQSVDENDVISTMKDAANNGKFGHFSVDPNSIKRTLSMSISSPSPTERTPVCNCSCNTVLWVIIGILGAIIIVLIIIIVLLRKKGTATRFRSYKVPRGDAGSYDNELAMEDVTPANVPPSSSNKQLITPGRSYMELQETTPSERYCTHQSKPTILQSQKSSQPAYYAPTNPETRSWEVPRENVTVDKIIGKGSFGQVAKATAIQLPLSAGKTTVAVKMLKPHAAEADKKDLLSELELMKTLKPHPHIIKLMGCVTISEPLLVLIEYVPYGDLLGYLRKSRGLNDTYYKDPDIKPQTTLTSQQLMKFAWQIADGMNYLSSRKIIHRDLAARNVLVGEGETCKVTDFGMARDVEEEDIYEKKTRGRLPVKWTAYESLLYGTYTTKSDVWSYGIVLYEIFTIGGSPYPRMNGRRLANVLEHGYRMSKPQHVDDALYEIMMNCWQNDPEARPSFTDLTKQLKEMGKQHKRLIYMNIYDNDLYGNVEDLNV